LSSTISLTNAVTSGDESVVAALLDDGADVNETTGGGQTVLILAVIFGHTNLVRLLVNSGADPQLRDNLGLNAVDWARRRGSSEALELLTNTPQFISPPTVEIKRPVRAATPPVALGPETSSKLSDDEKSRRWLAGLKQRMDEQELRRLNRNEVIKAPRVEPVKDQEPLKPMELEMNVGPAVARILEPPREVPATQTGKRNVPLFWILVLLTLSGSIVLGSIITTYLFRSQPAAAPVAPPPQPTRQQGFPEVSGELVGKAVLLPEAECPISGSERLSGAVTVDVKVDRTGTVYWARGSGGDWLMRGAATEAAMKSTFSPEKLRGREAEGRITYTFKPQ
jgi:hypothetical protein